MGLLYRLKERKRFLDYFIKEFCWLYYFIDINIIIDIREIIKKNYRIIKNLVGGMSMIYFCL